jgi:uncharacterized protein (DUF608 family)
MKKAKSLSAVQPPFTFRGEKLLQLALPIGGLGAGSVCMNGHGGLQDFSLRHRPYFTAIPDGHAELQSAFALIHLPETKTTRLVEGPLPVGKIYDQGLKAQGYRVGGYEGFPRFRDCTFEGEFPFGHANLADKALPIQVRVTGFNPFIPLDDKNSGIPCAIMEYTLHNTSRKTVKYEFSYHLSDLSSERGNAKAGPKNKVIPGRGIFFQNDASEGSEEFGNAAVFALNQRPVIKGRWMRGGWFDGISALWREVSTGTFTTNDGSEQGNQWTRNGGSLLFRGAFKPGAQVTYPIVFTWYFPNSNLIADTHNAHGARNEADYAAKRPTWQPYYAGVWKDAADVAGYVRKNYTSLRSRTLAFKDALFRSTVPREVIDAVSSNLAILKSPTVLRQKNGNVWGWEGIFTTSGCCSGTCTHVWNYAQALPHLFPQLERGFREQELVRSMDDDGYVTFRSTLPDGPAPDASTRTAWNHPAADGQLGGILKVYRDWQISGDTEWMKSLYPRARTSLEFGINCWDPKRVGALFEPHHNTYDIEFWGAEPMCTTIYIGALSAFAAMAKALGNIDDEKAYRELAEKGARYMNEHLFNGEYYQQQVEYRNLRDQSFVKMLAANAKSQTETARILRKDGPKYQYGSGCLSDAVIGGWMAGLYGVDTPLDRDKVRKTLRAIFRHNFKHDLSAHVNCQRSGYAMGEEGGLLICSWPRGGKPTLPFVYSDEVWTGIEYQVASHLISEGLVKEGLAIVKMVRSRYEGRVRNPWNEYECGSFYARAMASYALLPALSGFRYSAVEKAMWFGPKLATRPFTTFFSTASGFGTITLDKHTLKIGMIEGKLSLNRIHLTLAGKSREIAVKVTAKTGKPTSIKL